jgi:hypothetical protein
VLRLVESTLVVGLAIEHLYGGNNSLASGHSVHDDGLLVNEKSFVNNEEIVVRIVLWQIKRLVATVEI